MSEATLKHMHEDLEQLKQDMALVKNILLEERELTPYAKELLKEARATPDSEYIFHKEVKKRILK